jgi:hypothetical protein
MQTEEHSKQIQKPANVCYAEWWQPTTEEIARLKELIWPAKSGDGRKAYDPRLVSEYGGDAGILVGHFLFWTNKSTLGGGWFWKSVVEIERETGISEYRQRKARKRLKARGALEERRVSRRKPLRFRVNLVTVAEHIGVELPEYLKLGSVTEYIELGSGTQHTNLESDTEYLQLAPRTTENTTESTAENTYRDTSLQAGGRDLSGRAADAQVDQSSASVDDGDTPTDNDIPDYGLTPTPDMAAKEKVEDAASRDNGTPIAEKTAAPPLSKAEQTRVWLLLLGDEENEATRLADLYLDDETDAASRSEPITVASIAAKVREKLGGDVPLEAYVPWVAACLEERRTETTKAAV